MILYNTPYGYSKPLKHLDDTFLLVNAKTLSNQPLLVTYDHALNIPILDVMLHTLLYDLMLKK